MRYVAMQSIAELMKVEVDNDYLVCFIEFDVTIVVMRLLENFLLKFLEQT